MNSEVDDVLVGRLATEVARRVPAARELALRLHAHPEVGLAEEQASGWLAEALAGEGFTVERGVADLVTAFVGVRQPAGPSPTVAFLAEYDALPGLGHACGHNLIAGATWLGATALAAVLEGRGAQVRVIGCPAEESYGGKVRLVERGVFADVDLALMAHGHSLHLAGRPAMGRKSVVIEYHGQSAHAASAPDRAANALDAMVLLFSGIGLMRQQLRPEARVHGVITHGGEAANIIPEYTRAELYVRSFAVAYQEELEQRLLACARGAAEATGTRLEVSSAALTMLPVQRLQSLESCYEEAVRDLGHPVGSVPPGEGTGSTDFGNVSQVVPALLAYFSVGPGEHPCHTRAFAEAARSEAGLQGMVTAAHALALMALRLIRQPGKLSRVRAEFSDTSAPEAHA